MRVVWIGLALLVAGCVEEKQCFLPDGSPAGFIQSAAPGHQVQPAGSTGYIGLVGQGCPQPGS